MTHRTTRISKGMLHRMINEEISRANVKGKSRLIESYRGSALREIDSYELVEFGKAWRSMGDAVAEQVIRILDNPQADDVNPNAIELAEEKIGGFNEEIDAAIGSWKEYYMGEPGNMGDDEDES
jgi:hypothetical protein